jgi:hypothetical protein
MHKGNGLYIFVISGAIEISGEILNKRDAIGIEESNSIELKAVENSEILLIEVPLN